MNALQPTRPVSLLPQLTEWLCLCLVPVPEATLSQDSLPLPHAGPSPSASLRVSGCSCLFPAHVPVCAQHLAPPRPPGAVALCSLGCFQAARELMPLTGSVPWSLSVQSGFPDCSLDHREPRLCWKTCRVTCLCCVLPVGAHVPGEHWPGLTLPHLWHCSVLGVLWACKMPSCSAH